MNIRITALGVVLTAILGMAFSDALADDGGVLPSSGRSLFDHLVTKPDPANPEGKYVYDVPYPLSALVRHLTERVSGSAHIADTYKPTVVLIPNGRSLQKDLANVNKPRLLIGFTEHPPVNRDIGMTVKDRLYIGFAEKAHQLEVISYNEVLGRYEFQVVTDYREGGTPKVAYADRNFCGECHRSGTPLFSKNPWDETNANMGVHTALLKNNDEQTSFYEIASTKGSRGASYSYDTSTDRANRNPHFQKLWVSGCRNAGDTVQGMSDEDCRAQIFLTALANVAGLDTNALASGTDGLKYEQVVQVWKKNLTADQLKFDLSDIPSRNPSGFEEIQLTTIERERDRIDLWTENLKNNLQLSPEEDPKTTPKIPYRYFDEGDQWIEALDILISVLSGYVTPAERQSLPADEASFRGKILSAYERVMTNGASRKAFGPTPFRKGAALDAVFNAMGTTTVGGAAYAVSCCDGNGKLPPAVADTGEEEEGSTDLALFNKYCFTACHGTMPGTLGFLKRDPGMSDRDLWLKIVATEADQLCVRLDWNLPATELAANQQMPRGPRLAELKNLEKTTGTSDRKLLIGGYKKKLLEFAEDQAALDKLGVTGDDLKQYAEACNWSVYTGP